MGSLEYDAFRNKAVTSANIIGSISKIIRRNPLKNNVVENSPAQEPTSEIDVTDYKIYLEDKALEGGVLVDHLFKLEEQARSRNICICIRAVNKYATSLIAAGYGTKDMSIKAKSSMLPPLNGLIPRDQSLGKKGYDPKEAKKYSEMNEKAIEDGVATAVPCTITKARLDELCKDAGLKIVGTWDQRRYGRGQMTSTGFSTAENPEGTKFTFWGEKRGDKIAIFRTTETGKEKGQRVEVMANREKRPVTADYDLALVCFALKDIGQKHLKPFFGLREAQRKQIKLRPLAANGKQASGPLTDAEYAELSQSVMLTEPYDPVVPDSRLARVRSVIKTKLGMRLPAPPSRNRGIIRLAVRELLPKLNEALGRKAGQEVFHHGEDADNPYSDEADNYPMTVILPPQAAVPDPNVDLGPNPAADPALDCIRVVYSHEEFVKLAQDLIARGYDVPINERWLSPAELTTLRNAHANRVPAQNVIKGMVQKTVAKQRKKRVLEEIRQTTLARQQDVRGGTAPDEV